MKKINIKNKQTLLKLATLVVLAIMYLGAATAVRADVSECDNMSGITMKRVSYVPITFSNANDLRATCIGNTCTVNLKGWLYYPDSATVKNAPVLIYNHGSGKSKDELQSAIQLLRKAEADRNWPVPLQFVNYR